MKRHGQNTAADDIANELRDRIIQCTLAPGTRLIETAIAEEFGVSRTPVREAIRRLEAAGLAVVSRQGSTVREFSLREMDETYEVRIVLETLAVNTLAGRVTPADIGRLNDVVDASPEAGEPAQALASDEEFHETIAELCGNHVLLELLRTINERIHIIRWIDFTDNRRIHKSKREHAKVVELLNAGQFTAAREALIGNIRSSKAHIQEMSRGGLARVYLKDEQSLWG